MSGLMGRLSFIGKRPINFRKADVSLSISPYKPASDVVKFGKLPFYQTVKVSGRLGAFEVKLVDGLTCTVSEGLSPEESKLSLGIDREKYESFNKYQQAFVKSMHGTTNSLLMNYVEGISEGHQVTVQLVGVGYKVTLEEGNKLVFRIGYSHPVSFQIPKGIQARLASQTKFILTGPDYQQITQFAALVRSKRPPEPYNGKGIFVDDEKVIRKEGKKTK